MRRKTGQKAVGHAGTLDPLATGLLILLLGKWTKRANEFLGMDKSYEGTMSLGVETNSYDLDGKICSVKELRGITAEMIADVFVSFTGTILQTPPIFSALKKDGKKMYELARKGEAVIAQPREVRVSELTLNYLFEDEAAFTLSCSKGTYVRSLAFDLGRKLGCGACLSSLVRTRIGNFRLSGALTQEELGHRDQKQIEIYLNENLSRV